MSDEEDYALLSKEINRLLHAPKTPKNAQLLKWLNELEDLRGPVAMILTCPSCGSRHIDEGKFAYHRHTTHACQTCGMVWRPALVPTVGVQFLPGFKNKESP